MKVGMQAKMPPMARPYGDGAAVLLTMRVSCYDSNENFNMSLQPSPHGKDMLGKHFM